MHRIRGHLREAAVGAWASRHWRAVVLLFVVMGHVALFYVIWNSHTVRNSSEAIPKGFTGRTLFGPVISTKDGPTLKHPILSMPLPLRSEKEAAWASNPPRLWRFPAIDLWPSPLGLCPIPIDFNLQARADTLGALNPPERPPRGAGPRRSMLRMIRWLRPVYPIESALTDMEGSVLLNLQIDPQGRPIQVTLARSSGAPGLDAAALHAAHFWRFALPVWKVHPVPVEARVALRFRFFSFGFSRLGDRVATTASGSHRHGKHAERADGHEPVLRGVIADLQSGAPDHALDSPAPAAQQALTAALHWWGPVTHVAYVGFDGNPEWRTYVIKREDRPNSRQTSVAVRWEIYEVSHEAHTSLWKGAFDRLGQLWAIKADLVPRAAKARSTPGCVDDETAH
jgi:TonB family protein